ncbi:MAG: TerB family tellurite resistance protein, partial [Acidihalobacter sp.]
TLLGGPVGAIIGLGLGWLYDSATDAAKKRGFGTTYENDPRYTRTTPGDFAATLLVLIAAVMKADGKVVRSELDHVKIYLVRQFGQDSATEALRMLRDILKQNIPVREVCLEVRSRLDYPSRLQLLHLLYGIANADGRSLARAIRARGRVEPVFVENIDGLTDALRDVVHDGDVVLTLGAGSIGQAALRLPETLGVKS